MAKPGLTLEDHRRIAKRLQQIYGDLGDVMIDATRAYGVGRGKEGLFQSALKDILQIRSTLEEYLIKEFPKEFSPAIYFGHPEQDQE